MLHLFSKCLHVLRKIDFQFSVKTIDISYPVFRKLIPENGKPSHICVDFLRKIWHSVVSIFYKIRDQFRIFSVILELAVIFDFFALLYRIWIYLDNADSIRNHPCSQRKPVVACRFKTQHDLFLIVFCRKCQNPCLGIRKAF